MALVKLITEDGTPLRTTQVGTTLNNMRNYSYFDISVPAIGSVIKHYKLNSGDVFEGESSLYKVLDVTQELQECHNGLYKERFIVVVKHIEEDSGHE